MNHETSKKFSLTSIDYLVETKTSLIFKTNQPELFNLTRCTDIFPLVIG